MFPDELDVMLLDPDARAPQRSRGQDAAYDLRCLRAFELAPGERVGVRTGVAVALPDGCCGLVRPRSGLALRHGIDVLGGLIDPGYRGDVTVILHNTDVRHAFSAQAGDRVAQLLLVRFWAPAVRVVASLPGESLRGESGFGSSGTA